MAADRIKVLPNVESAVGMKHPFDCPLEKEGSEWPYDSFTCRRLADESIRRAPDAEPAAPAPSEKAESEPDAEFVTVKPDAETPSA